MKCPKCHGYNLPVIESRQRKRTNSVYRKRRCAWCSLNIYTRETIAKTK